MSQKGYFYLVGRRKGHRGSDHLGLGTVAHNCSHTRQTPQNTRNGKKRT